MAKTNVSFEMSEKLKEQMDSVCEDLGMPPEEAFQIFAAKVVNEQGIPFEVTEAEYPDEECPMKKYAAVAAAAAAVVGLAGIIAGLIKWLNND